MKSTCSAHQTRQEGCEVCEANKKIAKLEEELNQIRTSCLLVYGNSRPEIYICQHELKLDQKNQNTGGVEMRDIKFRAWDESQKGWVIPYDGLEIYCRKEFLPGFNVDIKHKYVLSQYVGFKDKNGKEIYEGDFIEIETLGSDSHGDFKQKGKVVFSQEYLQYVMQGGEHDFYELVDNINYEVVGLEVIGNVYENPELIKEDA